MKTCGIFLALFALILPGCGELDEPAGQVAEKETRNQNLADFGPTAEQKRMLDEPVEFRGHAICPPKEYKMIEPRAPKGSVVTAWVGKEREDGTHPLIQVLIGTYPDGQRVPKLEDAIVTWMRGQKEDRIAWTQSEVEFGMINGRRFAKQTWEGKEPNLDIVLRGVCFVAIEGRQLLALQTMDCGPDFAGLAIGEAALTTFK